jgi:hypothetical protein
MDTPQPSLFPAEPVPLDRVKPELRTAEFHGRILARQLAWARSRGLILQGSAGSRGVRVYTRSLQENLFEPLLPAVEAQFRTARGQELGSPGRVGKAQAIHSSAVLCINTFHHWLRIGRLDLVANALGFPASGNVDGAFEVPFLIDGRFGSCPSVDFVLRIRGEHPRVIAVECKHTEPFGRPHTGFPTKYFAVPRIWDGLAQTRRLAGQITGDVDPSYRLLHPKQLICHVLGLTQVFGSPARFHLHYLYYDIPGLDLHREEIEAFAGYLHADGIAFTWSTYQDLIRRLDCEHRDVGPPWCRYMASRYL